MKPSWSKFFVDLLAAGRVITQGAKFGKLVFWKKITSEDRPKNSSIPFWCLVFFHVFVGGGDFYHHIKPIKNPNGIFELVFRFFSPLKPTLKAEWDGFYRKMKELSKVSREVPAERPRCLHGGWAVFFWGFLVLRMAFWYAFCMVQKWLDP